MKIQRSVAAGGTVLALLGFALPVLARADRVPNIIYIIGDDIGWPYFGFMGSKIAQTPQLDRLAAEGTLFTHGFVTDSACRNSLRSLLTGLDPVQFNATAQAVRDFGLTLNRSNEIRAFETLPDWLGDSGYRSFQGGKYWEGKFQDGGFTHGMAMRPPEKRTPTIIDRVGGKSAFLGRAPMDELWKFLDERGEQPFFVWFAPMLPHVPLDPPKQYLDLYPKLTGLKQKYYANLSRLDDVVGQLISYLEKEGLRKDTLLIFVSDNGWEVVDDADWDPARGGPRAKDTINELGYRTPLIFNWPGKIAAGQVRRELVSSVDLFPTVLEFAGLDPGPYPGRSLTPLLTEDGPFDRDSVMGSHVDPKTGALMVFSRTTRWRYTRSGDVERLYEIDIDPFETRDVAALHPEVTTEMRGRANEWYKRANRWFPNPKRVRPLLESKAEQSPTPSPPDSGDN